jgi:hypothetical protein
MTKGRVALPFRFDAAEDEQQVPPLRYAPVGMTPLLGTGKERVAGLWFIRFGMTKGRVALPFRFSTMDEEQVVEKVPTAR